ncbi:hypothetical protein Tco_1281755, partial [Tanacetum coccineum]
MSNRVVKCILECWMLDVEGVDFDDSSKDCGVLDGALGDGVTKLTVFDEDVIIFLEYVPRFRDEFDGESRNSGKLPLLEWNQSSQARKDETVVDSDFCDFDSYNEFPPPWSAEIMITNRTKRLIGEFEFRKLLAKIDHVFGLENSSQDSLEFPYEVDFKQEMEELLNYRPNEVNFEQRMEELLYYDTYDGANISGKEGDLETWFSDEEVDQDIYVEWQDDPYRLVDELEESEEISDMFAKINQAMDELDQVTEAKYVTDSFTIYDQAIDDEGDV